MTSQQAFRQYCRIIKEWFRQIARRESLAVSHRDCQPLRDAMGEREVLLVAELRRRLGGLGRRGCCVHARDFRESNDWRCF